MFLIDFHQTNRKALLHGFVKGLGAPVLLYHREPVPPVPATKYVTLASVTPSVALAADWLKVGNDIRNVMQRHGQAATGKAPR